MFKYKFEILIGLLIIGLIFFLKIDSIMYRFATPHFYSQTMGLDFDLSSEEMSNLTLDCKFSDEFKNYLQTNFTLPENIKFFAKKCKNFDIALTVDIQKPDINNKILALKKTITDNDQIFLEYGKFRKISGMYIKKAMIKTRTGALENASLFIKEKEFIFLSSLQGN